MKIVENAKLLSDCDLDKLEEFDNLASALEVSSWTLAVYVDASGPYKRHRDNSARTIRVRSDTWLPRVGSEHWEILHDEVKDIEKSMSVCIRYALLRRHSLRKAGKLLR